MELVGGVVDRAELVTRIFDAAVVVQVVAGEEPAILNSGFQRIFCCLCSVLGWFECGSGLRPVKVAVWLRRR